MNKWLDIALVAIVVLASAGYALYLFGPRGLKNAYSKLATRYFGLRAAKWFVSKSGDCGDCPSHDEHHPWRKTAKSK
ncbi:MAG TPA: hypothetical protein VK629_16810 [Steroidobacteraceae bacterium]|nr:hypothetical protein [Steroidobacteraceae bacterium]